MNKFKKTSIEYLKSLRVKRSSEFSFFSDELGFSEILYIFVLEKFGLWENSDAFLIDFTINTLIKKNILKKDCLVYNSYCFNDFTYHDVYLKTYDNQIYSRGTSIKKATAYAKAIGEVLERTAIKYADPEILNSKSVADTKLSGREFLDFKYFPKATKQQIEKFEKFKIEDNDIFSFVEVRNYFSNEKIKIPAQLVFFGSSSNNLEKELIQPTTHGSGAGFTLFGADKSAIFEILHRHLFFKFWFAKKSPKRLKLETVPKETELAQKIKNFTERDFNIYLLDLNEGLGFQTSICILERFGGWYTGGATAIDSYRAYERALDEAFSTYLWCTQSSMGGGDKSLKLYKNVGKDFLDEEMTSKNKLHLFANSLFMENFDKFFIQGEEKDFENIVFEDNEDNFKEIVKNIFGDEVYVFRPIKKYLKDYDIHVSKFYISNSYYFPLDEIYTRPILNDNVTPIFTEINPFP